MPPKHFYRRRSFWLIALVVIIAPGALLLVIGQFTPAPGAWLVRQMTGLARYDNLPNLPEIEANVVAVTDLIYDGQHMLDIYYPGEAATEPRPVVLYIHGGGFVGGSKATTRTYGMALANAGYVVANMDYALAPEHRYPAPIIDANAALTYLVEHASEYGGDINRIFIGGNSAGAQITSQIAAVITDQAFAETLDIQPALAPEQLRGILLINGVYDMQTLRATGFPGISLFLWAYTGQRDFETYDRIDELSTVQQVTAAYPPVFITVGDADPLVPQTMDLITALEAHDVAVTPLLFTGTGAELNHDFALNLDTAYGQQAFETILAFLDTHGQPG
jgi:acetyl esterase/lipase